MKLYLKSLSVKLVLSGLMVLAFSITYSQRKSKSPILNCMPVKGDYLYAAVTELTNFQYLEFLVYQRNHFGDTAYRSMFPDTSGWKSHLSYNEPYVVYYHKHPSYREYPVVNISWQQAQAYCEWLEGILNQNFARDEDSPIAKVDVRLPTESEWELAARGGNSDAVFPWKGTGMRNTNKKFQGDMMANFIRGRGDYMGVAGQLNDNADITAPVFSYWPNDFGLYNMSGNVAEMLADKGQTKGGSWRQRAHYLEIDAEDPYNDAISSSPEIGFRYFVEVLERKPIKKEKEFKFSAKTIEKLLKPVHSDSVYVSAYEVTNQLYNQFLEENPNRGYEPKDSLWLDALPYSRRWANDYSSHPEYLDHPVVNISREQAVAFCEWLSSRYNSMEGRKYDRLEISLPTLDQWTYIAKGGLQYAQYPWGGPYSRNAKGCWLCNFNPVEERWVMESDTAFLMSGIDKDRIREAAGQDGAMVTTNVDAFHPNGFGAYNMSGNAAEMVSDADVVKGGSWGSLQPSIQISASEPYEGANPFTGFRFVAAVK